MNKPASELIEDLRIDLTKLRNQLSDIRNQHQWLDDTDDLYGGITCIIMAMSTTVQRCKQHEQNKLVTCKIDINLCDKKWEK